MSRRCTLPQRVRHAQGAPVLPGDGVPPLVDRVQAVWGIASIAQPLLSAERLHCSSPPQHTRIPTHPQLHPPTVATPAGSRRAGCRGFCCAASSTRRPLTWLPSRWTSAGAAATGKGAALPHAPTNARCCLMLHCQPTHTPTSELFSPCRMGFTYLDASCLLYGRRRGASPLAPLELLDTVDYRRTRSREGRGEPCFFVPAPLLEAQGEGVG